MPVWMRVCFTLAALLCLIGQGSFAPDGSAPAAAVYMLLLYLCIRDAYKGGA